MVRRPPWLIVTPVLPLPRSVLAITLYPFVFIRKGHNTPDLRRHELVHCWQVQRMGWFKFYLTYIWHGLTHKYRDIPAEIEARTAQSLPPHLEALV